MSRRTRNAVQGALWAWGDAMRAVEDGGWSGVSVFGRLVEEGPAGAAIRGAPGPRIPRYWPDPQILAVTRAVQLLNREKQQAVVMRYCKRTDMNVLADIMDIPRRSFFRWMDDVYDEIWAKAGGSLSNGR